ncbi:hypothetical protein RCL1_007443 [Eukaryota sp. TZLM3-RCL]
MEVLTSRIISIEITLNKILNKKIPYGEFGFVPPANYPKKVQATKYELRSTAHKWTRSFVRLSFPRTGKCRLTLTSTAEANRAIGTVIGFHFKEGYTEKPSFYDVYILTNQLNFVKIDVSHQKFLSKTEALKVGDFVSLDFTETSDRFGVPRSIYDLLLLLCPKRPTPWIQLPKTVEERLERLESALVDEVFEGDELHYSQQSSLISAKITVLNDEVLLLKASEATKNREFSSLHSDVATVKTDLSKVDDRISVLEAGQSQTIDMVTIISSQVEEGLQQSRSAIASLEHRYQEFSPLLEHVPQLIESEKNRQVQMELERKKIEEEREQQMLEILAKKKEKLSVLVDLAIKPLETILSYNSKLFEILGSNSKFLDYGNGQNVRVTNDGRRVESTATTKKESFVAVSRPENGQIVFTMKTPSQYGHFNTRIGFFELAHAQSLDVTAHCTCLNFKMTSTTFNTKGDKAKVKAGNGLDFNQIIVVEFSEELVTFAVPSLNYCNQITIPKVMLFGIHLANIGESWEVRLCLTRKIASLV